MSFGESFDTPPCPDRCLEDMGAAFSMGFVGGGVFFAIKGYRNSPKGNKISGSWQSVKLRAPTMGSSFAMWGGMFSVFDCLMSRWRKEHDSSNAIISGALTGGLLAARAGWRQAAKNAFVGGALLGVIEGVQILFERTTQHGPGEEKQASQVRFGSGAPKQELTPSPLDDDSVSWYEEMQHSQNQLYAAFWDEDDEFS
eukprot:TRINITY_DN63187_c0_g1_i2.p1 TRINITY_DN63187_c0_g1~~TRINITY_DN63187_c0_g1_i2.p1  ORF type:complete len:198 (-),score=86.11 TRINITY_DN63187_c0_g1_i2:54-647(-)